MHGEDKVLDALDRVAVQFGRPHPAGTGLGLTWDETNVMNLFLLAVVEDFRSQLVDELNGRGYYAGANLVESYEYH